MSLRLLYLIPLILIFGGPLMLLAWIGEYADRAYWSLKFEIEDCCRGD